AYRDHPRDSPLDRCPQVQEAEAARNHQGNGEKLGRSELVRGLPPVLIQQEVARAHQQAEQQRKPGERRAGDERYDARGRVALAEVGEHIEAGDDPDENGRPEVEDGVAVDGEEDQVFGGVAGPPLFAGGSWMSCDRRSSGTGKTITVLRSTPISVSVCK